MVLMAVGLIMALSMSPQSKTPNVEDSNLDSTEHKHTNHLIDEASPYLLSHAHNPVDWYPWGEEALSRARDENKPIFLSIGYAACHWCHVMERESFENESIATILNDGYVCIKVDREQRPDLDEIYMAFTTAMTGRGGWPMSVFLTPDLKPFYTGTYFPPEDSYGQPGFKRIIVELLKTYRTDKNTLTQTAEKVFVQMSARFNSVTQANSTLKQEMIERGVRRLRGSFDDKYGGFGQAPKFPHSLELSLFLRYHQATGDDVFLKAAEKGLTAMARGGIYDHVGGGFARYATDRAWLVPHFEKMLYDNALLTSTYVQAYRSTSRPLYLSVVRQTLDFILREMTDDNGGFFCSLDADSEGEEGRFYTWSKNEIDALLGDKSKLFCDFYNITSGGNFEGRNILNVDSNSDRVRNVTDAEDFDLIAADYIPLLLKARSGRIRPATDDKILTSWNGLALSAMCDGYQITGDKRYLEAARRNAAFVKSTLFEDGALIHAYRNGKQLREEFLEDYAYYVKGLLDLVETDIDHGSEWLEFAVVLAQRAIILFMDENGRWFLRPAGQEDLIVRPRDETDGSTPAPGSVMMTCLLKLNRISGRKEFLDTAEKGLIAISLLLEQSPQAMASALLAVDYYLNDKLEIVVVGDGPVREKMIAEIYRRNLPNVVLAVGPGNCHNVALFQGRESSGQAKAYICRNSVCGLPTETLQDLKMQLDEL
ncbi:MAG: thioredoxin domain-containing protein [candidate division Zixibacteria bacterium]|nr:thioredoxin domain-containing protein [candidate division Zixibacteria bacterium]